MKYYFFNIRQENTARIQSADDFLNRPGLLISRSIVLVENIFQTKITSSHCCTLIVVADD